MCRSHKTHSTFLQLTSESLLGKGLMFVTLCGQGWMSQVLRLRLVPVQNRAAGIMPVEKPAGTPSRHLMAKFAE